MPKTHKITPIDFEKTIMTKVKTNEIAMKPRWYFFAGSVFMFLGLVAFSIGAIFFTNITLFLLRAHGPNSQRRLQLILNSFPWWVPIIAVIGIVLGIWMLKKYDFSYKKNFLLVVVGFISAIFLAAVVIDQLGLNDIWSRQGPLRRFYQQIQGQNSNHQRGSGRMFNGKSGLSGK